jgi:hypothetical protein
VVADPLAKTHDGGFTGAALITNLSGIQLQKSRRIGHGEMSNARVVIRQGL